MGFASTHCYRNTVGKILAKLRVDYGESQGKQAMRLHFNQSYLSMVSSDRRNFTIELYKSIMEHYSDKAQAYKTELQAILIKDVKDRFMEQFPDATVEQIFYVMYGVNA